MKEEFRYTVKFMWIGHDIWRRYRDLDIKDLKKWYKVVEWIHLAHDGVQIWAFDSIVTKLCVV
jgi:hypothetical protein